MTYWGHSTGERERRQWRTWERGCVQESSQLISNHRWVFLGEEKAGIPGKKPSRCREENQQTQPTYDAEYENGTLATFVGSE